FAQSTLANLDAFAHDLGTIQTAVSKLHFSEGERWLAEVADGIEIDGLRARFVAALYHATLGHPTLPEADQILESAKAVVARRHAKLHHPDPTRLTGTTTNPTLYQYGYLHMADTLCYWHRERAEVQAVLTGSADIPDCFFR